MSFFNSVSSAFKNLGAQAGGIRLGSPLTGTIVSLDKVPDEAFATKVLGDGIAIDPTEGLVAAPFDGEVAQIFRTNHAVGLVNDAGIEVLIHIGIDTVKMNGEGFQAFVKAGQKVKAGDKLIAFDLALVKAKAKSAITPIVITNMDAVKGVSGQASGQVKVGQDLFRVEKKN